MYDYYRCYFSTTKTEATTTTTQKRDIYIYIS